MLKQKNKILCCCAIGQINRCESTGCEWKKAFGIKCSERVVVVDTEPIKPIKRNVLAKKVKATTNRKSRTVEKEVDFTEKIGLEKQDDWLKKIKFVI